MEKNVWFSIHRICQKLERSEIKKYNLPEKFNLAYVDQVMKPKLLEQGFGHMQVNSLDIDHLRKYPSIWAKSLARGWDRKFFHIRLKVR